MRRLGESIKENTGLILRGEKGVGSYTERIYLSAELTTMLNTKEQKSDIENYTFQEDIRSRLKNIECFYLENYVKSVGGNKTSRIRYSASIIITKLAKFAECFVGIVTMPSVISMKILPSWIKLKTI